MGIRVKGKENKEIFESTFLTNDAGLIQNIYFGEKQILNRNVLS